MITYPRKKGIYLTAVMAITSVSVIMTVIVLNFHYRGPIRKEMPAWIKNFLLKRVVEQKSIPLQYATSGSHHLQVRHRTNYTFISLQQPQTNLFKTIHVCIRSSIQMSVLNAAKRRTMLTLMYDKLRVQREVI